MNKKIAIAIPSYCLRYIDKKPYLLNNLYNFSNKYDVYVFLSRNDAKLNDYFSYIQQSDHVKLIITDAENISQKRQYMLDYLYENGYTGYFQFDDDVLYVAYKIDESTKRTTSETYKFYKCDMNEMLDKMVYTAEKYDAGYVTVMQWGYIGWQKPNKVKLNATINVAQFGYFDILKIKAHNLKYDLTRYVCEDLDMVIQMFQHKINTCTVCDYMFQPCNVTLKDQDQSTISTILRNTELFSVHHFIKYHCNLYIDKHGFLKPRYQMQKYWGTTELPDISDKYNQNLLKLAYNDDVEGIIKYIKENKK